MITSKGCRLDDPDPNLLENCPKKVEVTLERFKATGELSGSGFRPDHSFYGRDGKSLRNAAGES